MKYSIDEINIGDEVAFRSRNPSQPDYDECWTVHGKDGETLLIKLNRFGQEHYWTIHISEVVVRVPTGKK